MKTERLKECLVAVEGGADIYDRSLAEDLREIYQEMPGLVLIVKPQAYAGDGTDQVPFFGCITTRGGRELISRIAAP